MEHPFTTLSPFRYPGGKSWLRRTVIDWIEHLPRRPTILIEPFAGGGSISLAVIQSDACDRAIMAEIDPEVAAVWQTILSDDFASLISMIRSFRLTRKNVKKLLNEDMGNIAETAFKCIVRNRVQRAGILAPGAGLLLNGEDGKGLHSRWYPRTLESRIEQVRALAPRIEFIEGDGMAVLKRYKSNPKVTFFIDPPYVARNGGPGRRLYRYNSVNVESLFEILSDVAGPFFLTLHEDDSVQRLAKLYGFQVKELPMRTAHHTIKTELAITRR